MNEKAIKILNLIDELSPRNSYQSYREAVEEIKRLAVKELREDRQQHFTFEEDEAK